MSLCLSGELCSCSVNIFVDMTPETCANAFYNGELESELRRIGKADYRFKVDSDREECMKMVEIHRRESIYSHTGSECSNGCKERGTATCECILSV